MHFLLLFQICEYHQIQASAEGKALLESQVQIQDESWSMYEDAALKLAANDVTEAQRVLGLIAQKSHDYELLRSNPGASETTAGTDRDSSASSSSSGSMTAIDSEWQLDTARTASTARSNEPAEIARCKLCDQDEETKKMTMISCVDCKSHYHIACCGCRPVPFGLKFLATKMYGNWKCDDCDVVPISSHAVLGNYHRMLQKGLPRSKIEESMSKRGIDTKYLAYGAEDPVPKSLYRNAVATPPAASSATSPATAPAIALSAAPTPLAASAPPSSPSKPTKPPKPSTPMRDSGSETARKQATVADNAEATIPQPSPSSVAATVTTVAPQASQPIAAAPAAITPPEGMVAVSEHPKYERFFKMIKVGTPKDAAKYKMIAEKLNPDYIDLPPHTLVPIVETVKEERAAKATTVSIVVLPFYSIHCIIVLTLPSSSSCYCMDCSLSRRPRRRSCTGSR